MPPQPLQFTTNHPSEMLQVAEAILKTYPGEHTFTLSGDLGSGKTTFVKAFAVALGLEEEISSPTFSIVHEYCEGDKRIYHFDLYRIKNQAELFQFGFEEYLEKNAYVLIEWPEIALNLLPGVCVSIHFEAENENKRKIICRIVNS